MGEKETKEVKPTSRQRLASRYSASHPDVNFEDESVDIAGYAADELDALDADKKSREEFDGKMNNLFNSDPNAAKIFVGWMNGKDPVENLIELYGEDFIEALQSEEGKEKFKAALEKWRKGKDADAEHQKAYDANIAESAKNLVAFADKNGLTDDQVKALVEKAWQIGSDISEGRYTEEILNLVHKAGNYDAAVADAREEGRIEGKDENIRRELRKSKPATGLPATAGAQGAIGSEAAPEKPKTGKLDMFGGIPIKKK